MSQAFPTDADVDSGNGTDTDTESSNWSNNDGPGDIPGPPAGATPDEITAHLYWAYTKSKSNWRRHTGRPVRRVRRIMKRHIKGKGKGLKYIPRRGKNTYLAYLDEAVAEGPQGGQPSVTYFALRRMKGKGGRKGGKSFGKSFGRDPNHKNPPGPDGKPMECYDCGSDTHLRGSQYCPNRDKGKGGGKGNGQHSQRAHPVLEGMSHWWHVTTQHNHEQWREPSQ